MDVTTTLLLLAGAAVAAVPIGISVAAYKGVFGSAKPQSIDTGSVTQVASTPTSSSSAQVQTTSEPINDAAEIASQPLQEAPAPFPEDSITSSPTSVSTTSVPTDISAIAGISSASSAASPVLVIAAPKRRRSSAPKRLPSTAGSSGTPRKRRSTRKQPSEAIIVPIAPTTPATAVTIPEAPTESASQSETTSTEPQPTQQEA